MAVLLACGVSSSLLAQAAPSLAGASGNGTATVLGRVLNGKTGAPIARALVHLNSDRVELTDHNGKFLFAEAVNPVRLSAQKPGFTAEQGGPQDLSGQSVVTHELRANEIAAPIDLVLFPDGEISGVVTTPAGEPITTALVTPILQSIDANGPHVQPLPQARTNSHGEYWLQVQPGRYTLKAEQLGSSLGQMTLPASYPPAGAGDSSGKALLRLDVGAEEQIDLTLERRPSLQVSMHVNGLAEGAYPQFVARDTLGHQLQLAAQPAGTSGEMRFSLPNGSYTVFANAFVQASTLQGQVHIDVAGHSLAGLVLNMEALPTSPVEIEVDTTGAASGPATGNSGVPLLSAQSSPSDVVRFLALTLEPIEPDAFGRSSYFMTTPQPGHPVFQIPAGSYRVRVAGNYTGAYVRSASAGGTDLLREPLTVAAGAGGVPIRLVVSSATANVSGTVRQDGQAGPGSIALVPEFPSLRLVTMLRASSNGQFSASGLAPGPYRVLATERETRLIFEAIYKARDEGKNATLPFLSASQQVTLAVGNNPAITLDAVSGKDLVAAENAP